MGELATTRKRVQDEGMDRRRPVSYLGCGDRPRGIERRAGMTQWRRGWDGAGLECKILAAGRPWTVGDTVMVADGQWGVGAQPSERTEQEAVVEQRIAEGGDVEMTVEELARVVGAHVEDAHQAEPPA
ncbi:hypothetical protein ACFU5Z_16420 [Streptomyces sp. NPDC057521]|uniref:hypothetical protein n=1 Tax=Streptomyces sp. NPDC057521 TaxID=3346156 RepID=UPI0036B08F53